MRKQKSNNERWNETAPPKSTEPRSKGRINEVSGETLRTRRTSEGMGYDEKTAERVRRILSRRQNFVEKRMVGRLSFMVNGSMCCGVTSTGLMIRVGPEERERTLAQPYVQPMKFAGRPLAGFVCVDPEGYRTDTALAAWVRRGIDFVSTLPPKKQACKPRPSRHGRR